MKHLLIALIAGLFSVSLAFANDHAATTTHETAKPVKHAKHAKKAKRAKKTRKATTEHTETAPAHSETTTH